LCHAGVADIHTAGAKDPELSLKIVAWALRVCPLPYSALTAV
jgi:hypothetical protein